VELPPPLMVDENTARMRNSRGQTNRSVLSDIENGGDFLVWIAGISIDRECNEVIEKL